MEIHFPGAGGGGFEREPQPLVAEPQPRFSLGPCQRERDLRGNHLGELALVLIEHARRVVIEHELPDHAARADERDEGEGADALVGERRLKGLERSVLGDVGDGNRLGVRRIGGPR